VAAEIRIDQPTGAGSGNAGEARADLWLSQEIELHDVGAGAPTTRLWTLEDRPPGSAAVLADDDQAISTFTPDVAGTYKVHLRRDGSVSESNNQTRVLRVTDDAAGAALADFYPLPAYLEENDHSEGISGQGTSGRGFAPLLEAVIGYVRNAVAAATSAATAGTIAKRDGSGDSTFATLFASTLKRLSGALRLEGEAGLVCADGSDTVCTLSYPSASLAQIEGGQTTFRVLNAQSSGQIITRCSASGGFAGYDVDTFGMRSRDGFTDYVYFVNKATGLPTPGSAISHHCSIFPDTSGGAPNGQLRFYGKQKIWQEMTCQDQSGTGATSKRILDRLARLTSSTAAVKDVLTVAAADLPSGDWTGRVAVEWGVASVTEAASAGGKLAATIERFGGTTAVTTAAADQIIGVQDNQTASIDTTTDTPRIVADGSGNLLVRIKTVNTDDVRLWARAYRIIAIEH
jgi:hypothetical protein